MNPALVRECLAALLLEGATFTEEVGRQIIYARGLWPEELVDSGLVAPRYPGGLVTITFCVTDKGKQFLLEN